MKKMRLAILLAILMMLFIAISIKALAASDVGDDTDNGIVGAKVVEIADAHISVVARSGVEHVIAVDSTGTRVTVNGVKASLKDLRNGDVVAVQLDAKREVKFASSISARSEQIAKVRR